ncbi:MAG TPA: hypothetical protein VJS92_18325 [Candidatus Polarisedimenticolaceae bacterium]|nr:hypothetical protein [Candidatus Polarisedimenticolaceae bacterium]
MIELRDRETGVTIGMITKEQLEFLKDQLEEEDDEDTDYFIDPATLELLEQRGIDAALLKMLRGALGDREEMELEWSEE